jgi:hypothetical protein
MIMRAILGVFVIALAVAGCAGTTGSAAPAASASAASASQGGSFGGTVTFKDDGKPATTTVDAVADGATVSGTAVTEFAKGTHTVALSCASQDGDWWALGGKTDKTTIKGEKAGDWSAVIVMDGSPQMIAIWLSDPASNAPDCGAWLAKIDFAGIGLENLTPVESGTLAPPPALAP